MAEKLTDRTAKTSNFADADVFHLVDVSDTSQDPAGSSFKVSLNDIFGNYFAPRITSAQFIANAADTYSVTLADTVSSNHYLFVQTASNNPFVNVTVNSYTSPEDGAIVVVRLNQDGTGDLDILGDFIATGGFSAGIYTLRYIGLLSLWTNVNFVPIEVENGFIPLSGTTVGNPVTGDIEFDSSGDSIGLYRGDLLSDTFQLITFADDGVFGITVGKSDGSQLLEFQTTGLLFADLNPTSIGIHSSIDFSPNITDLCFVQKIYVDTIAPSIQLETPSTGGTVTATAGKKNHTVMVDTVLLAALTINLPATPVDGQICRFVSVGGITALTLAAPGGASIVGTITTLVALVGTTFQYNTSNTTWYRSV
jgi:hypothetical protein